MRRISFITLGLFISGLLFAGGIMTNTNQSAMYTRMLVRDATLGIDAVYYNPAGLTLLPNDGLHISLNNQFLLQDRLISSDFFLFNSAPDATEFKGTVTAPFFPGFYAAYKTGNWAFSLGFNPVGGGGGAEYKNGLPSFEMLVSSVVPTLSSTLAPVDALVESITTTDPMYRNVGPYDYNVYFEGSSVYLGYQFNASYVINDLISIALGGRYVMAKNTYQGYLRDIVIGTPDMHGQGMTTAGNYMRFVADEVEPISAPLADQLRMGGLLFDAETADRDVDVVEKGTGFTPIVGVNLNFSEKLNIALKYEHQTKVELETEVIDNKDGGLFEDGAKSRSDMPGLIVMGATYKPTDNLMLSGGLHLFLDKMADYGITDIDESTGDEIILKNADILNNTLEIGFGIEYGITGKLNVSLGYLRVNSGATEEYNSDLSYTQNSNTFGGGFEYKFSPMLDLNLGVSYTMYEDFTKTTDMGSLPLHTEIFKKDALIFAIGLSFNLGVTK